MENFDLRNELFLYFDFYLVAKEGNISKAANKYYISQPSLTRNVKLLEEKLSLQLYTKTNKGINLTLDGKRLFKKIEPVFTELSKTLFNACDEKNKENIVIGTTRNISDFKLEKYLSKFIKLYPSVKVNIITDSASNLNSYLIDHKIDVLFDYLPQINNSEKYNFEVRAIDQFQTCFACSEKYFDEIKNEVKSLNDLDNYNLVIPGSSRRRQLLDIILQKNNINLNDCSTMPDSKLMIDFVNNNDYIGYFTKEEIESTNLKEITLKEEMPINSIGIIYHKSLVNKIVGNFLDIIIDKG